MRTTTTLHVLALFGPCAAAAEVHRQQPFQPATDRPFGGLRVLDAGGARLAPDFEALTALDLDGLQAAPHDAQLSVLAAGDHLIPLGSEAEYLTCVCADEGALDDLTRTLHRQNQPPGLWAGLRDLLADTETDEPLLRLDLTTEAPAVADCTVVVEVLGGAVQAASASRAGVRVIVLDADTLEARGAGNAIWDDSAVLAEDLPVEVAPHGCADLTRQLDAGHV